jgi:hypothetical protein
MKFLPFCQFCRLSQRKYRIGCQGCEARRAEHMRAFHADKAPLPSPSTPKEAAE